MAVFRAVLCAGVTQYSVDRISAPSAEDSLRELYRVFASVIFAFREELSTVSPLPSSVLESGYGQAVMSAILTASTAINENRIVPVNP